MVGWATATTGDTTGVWGQSNSTTGKGVYGWANSPSGATAGVYGVSSSYSGRGVIGWATATGGPNTGVFGQAGGEEGTGVFGWATSAGPWDANVGVSGQSDGGDGARGVVGVATRTQGDTIGVLGESYSNFGVGVRGYSKGQVGVHGECESNGCVAVHGEVWEDYPVDGAAGGYFTVWGSSGVTYGVYSRINSASGYAGYFYGPPGSKNYFAQSVGIGTSSPAFLLEVDGSAGKPGGGSWAANSDRRLKRDIRDLEGSLDSLLALRGVSFEYLDPDAINERPGERIGMVAQEVEEVFPDWVDERADGYKAVSFSGFEALTVEALRELRAEKDAEIAEIREQQASQHAELARENADLRARLERLEGQLRVGALESAGDAR
jgi:hypothetical protein